MENGKPLSPYFFCLWYNIRKAFNILKSLLILAVSKTTFLLWAMGTNRIGCESCVGFFAKL